MTTTIPSVNRIERHWLLVDAKGLVLGRLAARIADILRGKHKASYTPFLDTGDFIIVINAEQVVVTGQKAAQKRCQRYSGYPGGLTEQSYERVHDKHPERIIKEAVWGMMPDGPLARQLMTKLKIYKGAEHPHAAQQPQPISDALMRTRKVKA